MTDSSRDKLPSTGAAELIHARVHLLHGLGRPAVERWEAAGMPLPPPELGSFALTAALQPAAAESILPGRIDRPEHHGYFA